MFAEEIKLVSTGTLSSGGKIRNKQGFTLVELLVVVVILVVIAAIAIPLFLNQKDKAAQAAVIVEGKNANETLNRVLSQLSAVNLAEVTWDSVNKVFVGGGLPSLFTSDGVTLNPDRAQVGLGEGKLLAFVADATDWCIIVGDEASGAYAAFNRVGEINDTTLFPLCTGLVSRSLGVIPPPPPTTFLATWGRYEAAGTGMLGYAAQPQLLPPNAALGEQYFVQVVSGVSHTCGFTNVSKIFCWGDNAQGQGGSFAKATRGDYFGEFETGTIAALSGKTITGLSLSTQLTCLTTSTNELFCYGENGGGRNTGSSSGSSLIAGKVSAGTMIGREVQETSLGPTRSCHLATDETVHCSGSAPVGDGTTTGRNESTAVVTGAQNHPSGLLSGVKKVSTGYSHMCAIADESGVDKIYCWGAGSSGQLGRNSSTQANSPVATTMTGALSGKSVREIGAGYFHTCAVDTENSLYCWGANGSGQLGDGTTTNKWTPVKITLPNNAEVDKVVLGSDVTCVLTTVGDVLCAGANNLGQLGDGTTTSRASFAPVQQTAGLLDGGQKVTQLSTFTSHTCAVTTENKTICWGANTRGQLTGVIPKNATPQISGAAAFAGKNIKHIDSSTTTSMCAIVERGTDVGEGDDIYCWSTSRLPAVVDISGTDLDGKSMTTVTRGSSHQCVSTSDGEVWCWGSNSNRQLADGTTSERTKPVRVSTGEQNHPSGFLSNVTQVHAALNRTCAVTSDGAAYCWGNGPHGNGTNTTVNAPVRVSTGVQGDSSGFLTGVTQVSVARDHSCAITTENGGKAYCWGNQANGKVGNGVTSSTITTPVAVLTTGVLSGKSIVQISAGARLTCAVTLDEKVFCWGAIAGYVYSTATSFGFVNNGSLLNKPVKAVSVGAEAACVVATDNTVHCFGDGRGGERGNNNYTRSTVTTLVDNSAVLSDKTVKQVLVTARSDQTVGTCSSGQHLCNWTPSAVFIVAE